MTVFLLKMVVSAAFAVLIWAAAAWAKTAIAWWLAAGIAVTVVFVGLWLIDRQPARRRRWQG